MTEAEYVKLTDLAKLRIICTIMRDVMESSFPDRGRLLTLLSDRIEELEGEIFVQDDGDE